VVGELSNLYQQVFESMLAGLITVDQEGRITSANRAARAILHRPLEPGTPIDSQGFGPLADLGSRVREQRFELAVPTPEAEPRTIGGNLVALYGPDQRASGQLLVFQDLTQLKALQERTRLSERLAAVGELSSEIAHELRNPMASILGCVQILRQGDQPRPTQDRVLNILARESERVSTLVTDFLDFTRPRTMRLQAIRLPDMEEEVRASWETDARNRGLTLAAGVPPDVWILGDTSWVHQVFSNLLSNARKALKGAVRPTIRLAYQLRPGRVLVAVSDNGCGMGEERRRSIFIPFSCGFEEGTGLGMSLVFQFVQQMGWDIEVASALGQGTTIHLSIPIHPGTSLPPAAHHE
jgi:two-component system sensor histidine kinase PilS (NtrC family)